MTGARRWAAGLLLAAAMALATPRAPAAEPGVDVAAAVPAPLSWPARAELAGAVEGERGVIVEIGLGADDRLLPRRLGPDGAGAIDVQGDDRVLAGAVRGDARVRFEGPGAMVFLRTTGMARRTRGHTPPPVAGAARFVSARPAPAGAGVDALAERTWFTLIEPEGEARGLVVVMPGLLGEPGVVIEQFITRLRSRGFVVLRMLAQGSRFVEGRAITLDPAAVAASARLVAEEFTQRTAECAYAVQSAARWAESRVPALAGRPRAIIGISAGAMTLPSIVALEPDRYGAAVLIAGGADWLSITDRSAYAPFMQAVTLPWAGGVEPTPETRAAMSRSYLEACPLDPYHTAAALRGKRVLVIHGTADLAVPSDAGDLLWERLGRPERWSFRAGHELLVAEVQRRLDRLADWVEGKPVAGPDAPPPAAP